MEEGRRRSEGMVGERERVYIGGRRALGQLPDARKREERGESILAREERRGITERDSKRT